MAGPKRDEAKSKGDVGYFFQEYKNVPMDDSFRIFKREDIQHYSGYYTNSDGIDYLSFILITIPARIIRFIITILLVNFLLNKILGKRKNINKTLLLSCW